MKVDCNCPYERRTRGVGKRAAPNNTISTHGGDSETSATLKSEVKICRVEHGWTPTPHDRTIRPRGVYEAIHSIMQYNMPKLPTSPVLPQCSIAHVEALIKYLACTEQNK